MLLNKGQESNDLVILDVGKKEKRNEADKKKRWHPEEIRDDYVEKLKGISTSIFGEATATKMFSKDFKQNIKCLKMFEQVFENDEIVQPFLDVLDVVIKWGYIKSNEISNIAFLKDLFTYFEQLVPFLIEKEYQFMEAEGTVFCLCLVEKIGMNNQIVKEMIKSILLKVGTSTLFYPKKVMSILIKGLESKNTKTVAECLECIAQMVKEHQLEVINDKDVKVIAQQCESADNGVRQGALLACEEIYKVTEDQFWVLVGSKLSTKAKDIIMARLSASLGVNLNTTPVEDKKNSSLKDDKSPIVGKSMRSSGLNRSLNKSIGGQNKLNSSIPSSESKSKLGFTRNNDRNTVLNSVQSTANLSKGAIDPNATPSRRKESSVNRKLERISSNNREPSELDARIENQMSKIKQKTSDEIVPEILLIEEDLSIEQDENLDTVGKNIKQLKYGDLSGKVDALVIINELITKKLDEAGDSLIKNSNFLIDSISKVLYDVFNKSPEKVPLKFGKYFISIVNKICSIKEIMRSVEEKKILILVEQLLLKLLIPGLDTLGERNEGQAMFRNLNNTILRILEN